MTDEHHIIPGGIGREALEGQLLMAKILQSPVGQFVAAALVIARDKAIDPQVFCGPSGVQQPVDRLVLTDIGNDNRVRAHAWQIKLL